MENNARDRRRLRAYYKRKLYGGRGAAARAVDFTALRLLLLAAVYLYLSPRVSDTLFRGLLSASATAFICIATELYKSIRLDKFKRAERARMQYEYAMEQLLLLGDTEYKNAVYAHVRAHAGRYPKHTLIYPLQQSEPLGEDALLSLYRLACKRGCEAVALFCPAPMSKAAAIRMKRTDIRILHENGETLCSIAEQQGLGLREEDIDAHILAQLEQEKQERRSLPVFATGRVRRYLLCAAGLFAASFFVEYALYYRLMAGLCLSFASLSGYASRNTQQQDVESAPR